MVVNSASKMKDMIFIEHMRKITETFFVENPEITDYFGDGTCCKGTMREANQGLASFIIVIVNKTIDLCDT